MVSIAEDSGEIVTIGLDPHPGTHTASAVGVHGLELDEITVVNDDQGWELLEDWANQFPDRRWAIEGPGNRYIRKAVSRLLAAGELVYGITPSMTAKYRRRDCRGKDDEIDAANAARALLANKDLPSYEPMPYEAELKELTRGYQRLRRQLTAIRMSEAEMTSVDVREAFGKLMRELQLALAALKRRMAEIVRSLSTELLSRTGVGPVVAATVLAEAGRISRFPSQDHFASYAGAAPMKWSSGAQVKVRVNPGGNRRLNWAAHIVAMSRLRIDPKTRRYRDKKLAEGKSQREVLRLLKTYICREFYKVLSQQ